MENVKQILEGYRWANIEIERLEKRKKRLQRKADQEIADSVTGSMAEYPYIERVIKIEGNRRAILTELEYQIDQMIEEGLRKKKAAEEIIERAESPREREILRSRFIDCLSWEKVGKRNHIAPDYAREIVRKFIKKIT